MVVEAAHEVLEEHQGATLGIAEASVGKADAVALDILRRGCVVRERSHESSSAGLAR